MMKFTSYSALQSSPFWTAVIGIFIYFSLKIIKWFYKQYVIRSTLKAHWPTRPFHWFWGHYEMVKMFRNDHEKTLEIIKNAGAEYPYGVPLYIGPTLSYLRVYHHSVLKAILGGSEKNQPKSDAQYHSLIPWLGKGLLLLKGKEWQRHRRLLTNSFHWQILQPYARKMDECSQGLLLKWKEKTKNGKPASVEIFEAFSLMTIDALLQCLFGFQSQCQTDNSEHQSYVSSIHKLTRLIVKRFRQMNVFMRADWIYNLTEDGRNFLKWSKEARDYAEKVIDRRRKEYADGVTIGGDLGFNKKNQRNRDFLDILLQAKDKNGSHLTNKEISDEVNTFMFEGHDTTTSAISWVCYCMAINPEHQEKCYNEVKNLLGDGSEIEWDDLSKFEYTTLCIKEAMRMYPPVPSIMRTPAVDVEVCGRLIKKDTEVIVSILSLHYNPELWPDPHRFDPLRFTPENSKGRDAFSYLPFSAGLRNCIGQNFAMNEIKISLSHVLHNFKLSLDESKLIKERSEVVYRAEDGINLMITPR